MQVFEQGEGQKVNKEHHEYPAENAVLPKQGGGFEPFTTALQIKEFIDMPHQIAVLVFIDFFLAFEAG